MEFWIRSQDRKILQKVNKLYVATYNEKAGFGIYDLRYDDLEDIDDSDVPLGFYKTKERALEVLDEIHNILLLKDMYEYDRESVLKSWENVDEEQVKIVRQQMNVYEMPLE